jgi:hypothetical protein
VVFRSTDFPKKRFNQLMMLPYFHDGVPHDQTLWIDELAVGTKRIGATLRAESSKPRRATMRRRSDDPWIIHEKGPSGGLSSRGLILAMEPGI